MYDNFPAEYTEGALIGWHDPTNTTGYSGGAADRSALLDQPLLRMIIDHPENEWFDDVMSYFLTHRGGSLPMLVIDWTCFSLTDEPMTGTVDGVNKTFGLVKTYSTGNNSYVRPIQHAESTGGTVTTLSGKTLETYSAWSFKEGDNPTVLTVDTSNLDQITFTVAPTISTGQPRATVGLFRVLMTFVNDELMARVKARELASISQIELIEEILRS